jgi:hypothetical protein
MEEVEGFYKMVQHLLAVHGKKVASNEWLVMCTIL